MGVLIAFSCIVFYCDGDTVNPTCFLGQDYNNRRACLYLAAAFCLVPGASLNPSQRKMGDKASVPVQIQTKTSCIMRSGTPGTGKCCSKCITSTYTLGQAKYGL